MNHLQAVVQKFLKLLLKCTVQRPPSTNHPRPELLHFANSLLDPSTPSTIPSSGGNHMIPSYHCCRPPSLIAVQILPTSSTRTQISRTSVEPTYPAPPSSPQRCSPFNLRPEIEGSPTAGVVPESSRPYTKMTTFRPSSSSNDYSNRTPGMSPTCQWHKKGNRMGNRRKTWAFWSFPISIHAGTGELAHHISENGKCVALFVEGW